MEIVHSQETVLASNGYVICVWGEGKSVYGTVTNCPAVDNRRFALWFDCVDFCVGDFFVRDKALWAVGFARVDATPDVEVATSVRGYKLVITARHPLDTRHPSAVYGTLYVCVCVVYVHVRKLLCVCVCAYMYV